MARRYTMDEKLNLIAEFRRRYRRNPRVHEKYRGICLGLMLYDIRKKIHQENADIFTQKQISRLKKMGIYDQAFLIKVEEKIDSLIEFAKKYPYTFNNNANPDTRDIIKSSGQSKEEIERDLQEYEKLIDDYVYIRSRISKGKISDENITKLKNARVGYIIGIADEDSEMIKKYNISQKLYIKIIKIYKSLENFKEYYIQYLLNNNADEYFMDIFRELTDGPKQILVTSFSINSDDLIFRDNLHYKIIRAANPKTDYLMHGQIMNEEQIVSMLDKNIVDNEKHSAFIDSIKQANTSSRSEIAKKYSITLSTVKQRIRKSCELLSSEQYTNLYENASYHLPKDAYEVFLRTYFDNHSLFYNEDVEALDKDVLDSLRQLAESYEHEYKEEHDENLTPLSHFLTIEDIDIEQDDNKRAYTYKSIIKSLERLGITSLEDLLATNVADFETLKYFKDAYKIIVREKLYAEGFILQDDEKTRYYKNRNWLYSIDNREELLEIAKFIGLIFKDTNGCLVIEKEAEYIDIANVSTEDLRIMIRKKVCKINTTPKEFNTIRCIINQRHQLKQTMVEEKENTPISCLNLSATCRREIRNCIECKTIGDLIRNLDYLQSKIPDEYLQEIISIIKVYNQITGGIVLRASVDEVIRELDSTGEFMFGDLITDYEDLKTNIDYKLQDNIETLKKSYETFNLSVDLLRKIKLSIIQHSRFNKDFPENR